MVKLRDVHMQFEDENFNRCDSTSGWSINIRRY